MAKTKEKSKSQSAADFNKIIADGRERKRNEALASKIFSSRRQSLPAKSSSSSGGSLASRVGIKKPIARPLASKRRASVPSRGNINNDWTHDLHDNSSLSARISRAPTGPKAGTGTPKANGRATNGLKGAAGRAAALEAAIADPSQVNIVKPQPSLTIRGLAGPFTVLGQNFAPGTTPADVESAMTPVGGEMISCSVVKTQPFLIMEMVFASREGGERVIETFNNKTADGRVIKIFPKIGSGFQPPTGPRATRNAGQVVDGKHGFSEKGTAIGGNKRRGGKR